MVRKLGYVLVLVAGGIIFFNVVIRGIQNRRRWEEHPVRTLWTGGGNLEQRHDFQPPYSGFEVSIIGLAVFGLACVVLGGPRRKS